MKNLRYLSWLLPLGTLWAIFYHWHILNPLDYHWRMGPLFVTHCFFMATSVIAAYVISDTKTGKSP